jgi:hypothetical protein
MTAPREMTATPLNRVPPSEYLASLISDLLVQGTEGDETPRVVTQARSRQAARVIATFCAPLASAPVRAEEPTLLVAINRACEIIEVADARNLANDGPAGGFPPQMTLKEWRTLYVTLDNARRRA